MSFFSRYPYVSHIPAVLLLFFAAERHLSAQDWTNDPSPPSVFPNPPGPQPGAGQLPGAEQQPGAEQPGMGQLQGMRQPPETAPSSGQTPRSVPSKIPSPTEKPEAYRSVLTKGHPLSGLLNYPLDPNAPVQGKPLALYELLDGDRSPQRRRQLLHAYWELVGSTAKYKLYSVREETVRIWHQDYARNAAQSDFHRRRTPLLQAAQQRAVHQCEILALDVLEKQYALQTLRNPQFMSQRSQDEDGERSERRDLPIPSDYPLDGAYLTRIDKMPTASTEARRLDRRLAIAHRAIHEHYAAAVASRAILRVIHERENADVFDTLTAYDQSLAVEEKMVDAVVAYNKLIADYTSETIPAGIGLYPLLTALIKLPDPVSLSSSSPTTPSAPPSTSPSALYVPSDTPSGPPQSPQYHSPGPHSPGPPHPMAPREQPRPTPHTPPLGSSAAPVSPPPTPPISIPENSPLDQPGSGGQGTLPDLPLQPSPLF